jgi:hypothetical protein
MLSQEDISQLFLQNVASVSDLAMLQQTWRVLMDPAIMQQALQLAAAAQWEDADGVLRGTFARIYQCTTAYSVDEDMMDLYMAAATGNVTAVQLALLLGLKPGSLPDSAILTCGTGGARGLLCVCMPVFDQQGRAVRHFAGGSYSVAAVLPMVQLLVRHGWPGDQASEMGYWYATKCLDAAMQLGDPQLLQALVPTEGGAAWIMKVREIAHARDRPRLRLLLDQTGTTGPNAGLALFNSARHLDVEAVEELVAVGVVPTLPKDHLSLLHYLAATPLEPEEQQVSASHTAVDRLLNQHWGCWCMTQCRHGAAVHEYMSKLRTVLSQLTQQMPWSHMPVPDPCGLLHQLHHPDKAGAGSRGTDQEDGCQTVRTLSSVLPSV